jgi:hypothetical protein
MCFGDYLAAGNKIMYISSPLFGIFDFFVFFKILMSLKKNKRMLRYKGGTSVMGNKNSSKRMEHASV